MCVLSCLLRLGNGDVPRERTREGDRVLVLDLRHEDALWLVGDLEQEVEAGHVLDWEGEIDLCLLSERGVLDRVGERDVQPRTGAERLVSNRLLRGLEVVHLERVLGWGEDASRSSGVPGSSVRKRTKGLYQT